MVKDPIGRYLLKRALAEPWQLEHGSLDGVDQAVCIPALSELETLPHTLDSLVRNDPESLLRSLVLVVVNNRDEAFSDSKTVADNQRTLSLLREAIANPAGGRWPNLRIACIDASSPGLRLPPKGGVGLARRIAMDAALRVLPDAGSILLSLDADTTVQPHYLATIRAHFDREPRWGAVIAYAHPLSGPDLEQAAIVACELFLRYHSLGLRYAGSPYAYHTIGSAMACTARAYAVCGGMNRRQAGEDFYFLERLAKTGGISRINDTRVYPSSRTSARVPFGTGKRVQMFIEEGEDSIRAFDPTSYDALRGVLQLLGKGFELDYATFEEAVGSLDPALPGFFQKEGLDTKWDLLRSHAADESGFRASANEWMGAFRTLKLIHHLRDHGHPERGLFEAISGLMERMGERWETETAPDLRIRREMLRRLRVLDER